MQNRRKTLEDGISSVNLWWLIEEVRGCNNKQVFLFGNQDMTWWTTQQQGFLQSRSESSMIINRKEKAPLLTQTLKKKHWLIDNWRRHTKITKRSLLLTKNEEAAAFALAAVLLPKASGFLLGYFDHKPAAAKPAYFTRLDFVVVVVKVVVLLLLDTDWQKTQVLKCRISFEALLDFSWVTLLSTRKYSFTTTHSIFFSADFPFSLSWFYYIDKLYYGCI